MATLLTIVAACILWTVMRLRIQVPGQSPVDLARLQWYAGSSLALCVFGISQAILLSVTERTREIGTLKCLGASHGFVVTYLLIESMALAVVGAVLGLVVGVVVFIVLSGQPPVNGLTAAWETMSVGLLATAVAAVPPAWQAGTIPGVAALRSEV